MVFASVVPTGASVLEYFETDYLGAGGVDLLHFLCFCYDRGTKRRTSSLQPKVNCAGFPSDFWSVISQAW